MGSKIGSSIAKVEELRKLAVHRSRLWHQVSEEMLTRVSLDYGCPIAIQILNCDLHDGRAVFDGPYGVFRSMLLLHGDLLTNLLSDTFHVYQNSGSFGDHYSAKRLDFALTAIRERMVEIITSGSHDFNRHELWKQSLSVVIVGDLACLLNSGPDDMLWVTLGVEGFARSTRGFGRCASEECRAWYMKKARGRDQRFCSSRCQNREFMRGRRDRLKSGEAGGQNG